MRKLRKNHRSISNWLIRSGRRGKDTISIYMGRGVNRLRKQIAKALKADEKTMTRSWGTSNYVEHSVGCALA